MWALLQRARRGGVVDQAGAPSGGLGSGQGLVGNLQNSAGPSGNVPVRRLPKWVLILLVLGWVYLLVLVSTQLSCLALRYEMFLGGIMGVVTGVLHQNYPEHRKFFLILLLIGFFALYVVFFKNPVCSVCCPAVINDAAAT